MNCKNCLNEIPDDATECDFCGEKVGPYCLRQCMHKLTLMGIRSNPALVIAFHEVAQHCRSTDELYAIIMACTCPEDLLWVCSNIATLHGRQTRKPDGRQCTYGKGVRK